MTETMAIFSCTFKPLLSVLAHIANEVAVTPLHGIARVLCNSADHRSGPSLVLTPQRYMIEARIGFDFHARSRPQSSIHIRDELKMYGSCITHTWRTQNVDCPDLNVLRLFLSFFLSFFLLVVVDRRVECVVRH